MNAFEECICYRVGEAHLFFCNVFTIIYYLIQNHYGNIAKILIDHSNVLYILYHSELTCIISIPEQIEPSNPTERRTTDCRDSRLHNCRVYDHAAGHVLNSTRGGAADHDAGGRPRCQLMH